jgi:hypothetical protein
MLGDSKVTFVINLKVERNLHPGVATTVQPQSETTKEAASKVSKRFLEECYEQTNFGGPHGGA